jgi:hypothetical protein
MSMMLCKFCDCLVDTDYDCDSLYTVDYPDNCVCESCRENGKLLTIFDEE